LGMCHSANAAFLDLVREGLVTCGSVMVPCPWFADLGVHLTLTSEWADYRWRPISTISRASGLIDQADISIKTFRAYYEHWYRKRQKWKCRRRSTAPSLPAFARPISMLTWAWHCFRNLLNPMLALTRPCTGFTSRVWRIITVRVRGGASQGSGSSRRGSVCGDPMDR
jgi:hypothetical protein